MSDRPKERLDKWLWFARFFKSRSISAKAVTGGRVRINGIHAAKASAAVSVGDVLTFVQGSRVRVVEVAALGTRRGPAPEAQALYIDRAPPPPKAEDGVPIARTGPRPTKRDRRKLDRITGMIGEASGQDGVDPGEDAD